MYRFFLTICGTVVLPGILASAQQTPVRPQIRTGVAAGLQQPARQPNLPPARGIRVPVAPGPNHAAAAAQAPAAPAQTVNPAPRKDPRLASAPGTSPAPTLAPMGPPAPPSVIPQPQRPADMPPVPPQVTYRDGLLTVNAVNSTMSSLLAAIRSRTGIEFDGAENSSERVAVSLGPAPEGEVLAAIFSGSGFDYVVLGRADSPETVQKVVLTPKARGAAGPVIAGRPPQQPQPQAQPEAAEEEVPDEAANVEQEPQDTAAQPPQVNPPPGAQPENQPQTGAPKTPEQLLQELKQMQQRQQEQQGGQPPNEQQPPTGNLAPRKNPPR